MHKMLLTMLMICAMPLAWAATRDFSFWCRTKVIRGNQVYYENRCHTYNFTIDVISDNCGCKTEQCYYRYPFICAQPGERYAVVIHNPMPVRVAANLMIDGMNSITGNPGIPGDGSKWLLGPNSTATIKGWQVNQRELRRFYFTSIEDSYARWRSYQLGQDLTVKCGKISVAYFWSKQEMEAYWETHPIHEYPYPPCPMTDERRERGPGETSCRPEFEEKKAGTGMGEKKDHAVEFVDFHYDTGMYREEEVVSIYYDFQYPRYPYYRAEESPQFAPEK